MTHKTQRKRSRAVWPVAQPAPQAPLLPRRILVVDDTVEVADCLRALLELRGHEVQVAHSGPAALEVTSRFRPEVVLLDIGMPGMSGHQVAQRIRAQPELGPVLLVAVTGWGTAEERRRSVAAGFDHHLTKPVDLAEIEALLREHQARVGA